VRPDGFIAWRSQGEATNPTAVFAQALARSLGHQLTTQAEEPG